MRTIPKPSHARHVALYELSVWAIVRTIFSNTVIIGVFAQGCGSFPELISRTTGKVPI